MCAMVTDIRLIPVKNAPNLYVMMNPKDKKLMVLKKCASTNQLIPVNNLPNLNLREAKSYAGTMAETKLKDASVDHQSQNTKEKCSELFCKEYDLKKNKKNAIATKDAVTEEVFYINEKLLVKKEKTYSASDIAWVWRKDCRMWLWKNSINFKKNRSVAEMKQKLINH